MKMFCLKSQAYLSFMRLTRQSGARSIFITPSSFQLPKMPDCEYEPEPYNGPSYDEILKIREKHISKSKRTIFSKPILFNQGKMQWLWDHEGKRYLDFFGGITTVGVGHCHPKVVSRLSEQANRLWHTSNLFMNSSIHTYAKKLVSTLPDNLEVCFFANSGSEANELAMVMSRLHTGAFDILSLRNSYHGGSPYTIGMTSHGTWKHNYANGFGIHHVMNPDPYRGIWGGSNCRDSLIQTDRTCSCGPGSCTAGDRYLEQLDEVLRCSCPQKISAFFIEGVQGVGGVVQFPKNYVKGAFELIRAKGGLCVSDEVQSGFGRLGSHMWGFETHGVVPDIITMAKSIGNGIAMSAVVTTREIADRFASNVLHLNTYAGNPLSTSAAEAVLDVIAEEGMQEKSRKIGNWMLMRLAEMRDEFEFVGDVRGKGLMIGVEMTKDKKTKDPMSSEDISKIHEYIKDSGLIIGRGSLEGNTFRIKPPMCINEDDASFALQVIKEAFSRYQNGCL